MEPDSTISFFLMVLQTRYDRIGNYSFFSHVSRKTSTLDATHDFLEVTIFLSVSVLPSPWSHPPKRTIFIRKRMQDGKEVRLESSTFLSLSLSLSLLFLLSCRSFLFFFGKFLFLARYWHLFWLNVKCRSWVV